VLIFAVVGSDPGQPLTLRGESDGFANEPIGVASFL
jgi:hypothetical protein